MQHILGMKLDASAYISQPAIVEAAKDWRYYENAILQHEKVGAKLYLEYKDSGAWKAHYKTWRDACEPLGKSRSQINKLIQVARESSAECATESPSDTLDKVNALAPPTEAELKAQLDADILGLGPTVHAGPAPMPTRTATPTPAATQEQHKPRVRNDNGKPVYALPVWKDLLDFYGHALNRLADANRAVPDRKLHDTMEAQTKDLMNKSREWREKAKHA